MSASIILCVRDWLAERISKDSRGYSTPCWVWQLSTATNGYARARPPGGTRHLAVHRVAYEEFRGPIPEGLEIDHLCSNRACVNPDHLEAVTHAENMKRFNWKRSVCLHGHPLEGANIKMFADGRRTCRTCNDAWFRARQARRRAAAA